MSQNSESKGVKYKYEITVKSISITLPRPITVYVILQRGTFRRRIGGRAVEGKRQVALRSGEATPVGETLALSTSLAKAAIGSGYAEKVVQC